MAGLAYYSIGLLVANQIHGIFAAGSNFLFPLVSKKIEQKQEIRHIYFQMQFLVISTGLAVLFSLSVAQDFIFILWLGKENYLHSKEYITLFLCFEAVLITSVIPYYYLISSGHIKLNTIIMSISTATSVIAMLLLFKWLGAAGLVWGKLLAIAVVSPFLYNILHKRVLGDRDVLSGLKLLLPSAAVVSFILLSSVAIKTLSALICFVCLYLFLYKKQKVVVNSLLLHN
jgi:O-antigen/teichoic acid export membrane protein